MDSIVRNALRGLYCGFPHTQIKLDLKQMWFREGSCYSCRTLLTERFDSS